MAADNVEHLETAIDALSNSANEPMLDVTMRITEIQGELASANNALQVATAKMLLVQACIIQRTDTLFTTVEGSIELRFITRVR